MEFQYCTFAEGTFSYVGFGEVIRTEKVMAKVAFPKVLPGGMYSSQPNCYLDCEELRPVVRLLPDTWQRIPVPSTPWPSLLKCWNNYLGVRLSDG